VVTSKSYEQVLTTFDSVKTITITLKDNGGNIKSHGLNGSQIKLSKSFDILIAINIPDFPRYDPLNYDVLNSTLAGIDYPVMGLQNITVAQIFDFNVGDIFESEIVEYNYLSSPEYCNIDTIRSMYNS
jgi:hypothetical protein